MNQSDIYKMIAVPTTELMEVEINSLLAQKDVLQSLYRYASSNIRVRITELLRTQDSLEAKALELLNLWKTQASIEEGLDPTIIEKATILIIQIKTHKSNIADVKKQMEGMTPSASQGIIDKITGLGPSYGINQTIWYGILIVVSYFLVKKVLK